MFRGTLLILVALGLSQAAEANVFGKDNRVPMERTDKPWSAIGFLSSVCSGTLVARDLVLTARHCVQGKGAGPLTFYANGIAGHANDWSKVKRVWKGLGNPNLQRWNDWAILQLVKPLGDTYGWMPVGYPSSNAVQMIGYSQDFKAGKTAGHDKNCEVKQVIDPLIAHDCDVSRGASGGPLLEIHDESPFLVGIAVAEYRAGGTVSLHLPEFSESFTNLALSTSAFDAALRKALEISNKTASKP